MKLFFRDSGKGEPLIVLHGLYGSSDNWVSIAKELEKFYRVILVDQRNHGQSPHSNDHHYTDLVNDLLELFETLKIKKAHLLGHSMGGKVAMQFAIDYPEKVESLIVVDITPWGYDNNTKIAQPFLDEHRRIISGLSSIPVGSITSRTEADAMLANTIKQDAVRQFLLKNLKRERDGSFRWRFNLPILCSSLNSMIGSITPKNDLKKSLVRTLFIKGGDSNYILRDKEEDLKKTFPNSELLIINEAGHWMHAEKPEEFLDVALNFLLS